MIQDTVARRFASQQMVNLVEAKSTNDSFHGYEDHEDNWRASKKELAKYVKVMETWAPIYRRIATALMTPRIADYAELMDIRVREIQEATQLCEKLMQETKRLDQALKELVIPDGATDEQLQALVTNLPIYNEAVVTASKVEEIDQQWAAEDHDGFIDTSLEDYLMDGKLRTRLSNGAIPGLLIEQVDLTTAAFGYLQGVLSPDTIADYAVLAEEDAA